MEKQADDQIIDEHIPKRQRTSTPPNFMGEYFEQPAASDAQHAFDGVQMPIAMTDQKTYKDFLTQWFHSDDVVRMLGMAKSQFGTADIEGCFDENQTGEAYQGLQGEPMNFQEDLVPHDDIIDPVF